MNYLIKELSMITNGQSSYVLEHEVARLKFEDYPRELCDEPISRVV
jgi:hypothetical protein